MSRKRAAAVLGFVCLALVGALYGLVREPAPDLFEGAPGTLVSRKEYFHGSGVGPLSRSVVWSFTGVTSEELNAHLEKNKPQLSTISSGNYAMLTGLGGGSFAGEKLPSDELHVILYLPSTRWDYVKSWIRNGGRVDRVPKVATSFNKTGP